MFKKICAGTVPVAVLFVFAGAGCGKGAATETATAPTTVEAPATSPVEPTTAPAEQTKADEPAGPTIAFRDGEPKGGVEEIEAKKGDHVQFTVDSDATGVVHVHGYDITKDVTASGPAKVDFKATLEGKFEVELHPHEGEEQQIAEITVNP